jgi:hypothetical protein
MTNALRSSSLHTWRTDIFAMVASLALTACSEDSSPIAKVDGSVEAGSPSDASSVEAGAPPDASDTCTGGRAWRYETPGCGAHAPARVCRNGYLDAACLGGYICTCAGKWQTTCFRAAAEPWAYLIPPDKVSPGQAPRDGTPCDPAVVPDGGVVPDGRP